MQPDFMNDTPIRRVPMCHLTLHIPVTDAAELAAKYRPAPLFGDRAENVKLFRRSAAVELLTDLFRCSQSIPVAEIKYRMLREGFTDEELQAAVEELKLRYEKAKGTGEEVWTLPEEADLMRSVPE
jgi:hypothetical protein